MNIWGIGPRIAAGGIAGLAAALLLGVKFDLRFSHAYLYLPIAGGVLILIGLFMWVSSGRLLVTHFHKGELITLGVFGIVRNPLYAAFILFVVPGLALVCNNWAIFGAALLMLIIFKLQIHKEEEALRAQFGEVYEAYVRRVKQIIPWIW